MSDFISGRLKKKAGYWRVDGVGEVLTSCRLGSRLVFLFSEIHENYVKNPFSIKASTGNTLPLKAHSSWLRLFTPGSVWHEGRKHESPETLAFSINVSSSVYSRASGWNISESNRNYKAYQSTEPDLLKGGTLKVKFRGYDISSRAKYFDNECRTFLEYSEELNGEATIYSENYVPQAVNCEMIIVAFTMNKVKFKKAKRGRTLVVEQK